MEAIFCSNWQVDVHSLVYQILLLLEHNRNSNMDLPSQEYGAMSTVVVLTESCEAREVN